MKIEEAVKRIEQMGEYERFIDEPISKVSVLNTIRQIDQPKPEVPKFVADWIEICDMRFVNLNYIFGENCPEKVKEWVSVYGNHKKMLQALLYGYTVEKEKLYTVNVLGCTLFKMTSDNHVRYKLIGKNETPPESKFDSYEFEANLTEKEIKQADERLWQWKKEVTE